MTQNKTELLTLDLLKKKLKNWTLSANLTETLGFKISLDSQIKKELAVFEEQGHIERTGARRGLKFKYKEGTKEPKAEKTEEVVEEYKNDFSIHAYAKEKEAIGKDANGQKEFKDYLKFVVKAVSADPSISSHSFVIKKLQDGSFVLRLYSGITVLKEEKLSEDKLIKFIKASGVKFE